MARINWQGGGTGLKKKAPQQVFEAFMKYKKSINLAEPTLVYYTQKITRFTEWLVNRLEFMSDLEQEDIYEYIEYLKADFNVNDESVNTHLRAVRAFISYCKLPIKVRLIKTQEYVKETYTDEELKIILKKPNKASFAEFRNWVLVCWLLATGNRLGTIVAVKIEDLDFCNELITLRHTKNKKAQIIPMSRSLSVILKEYLEFRGGEPEDYLFCTQYGLPWTKEGMREGIKHYHKKREISRHSIHLYRHTFAKLAIMNGIDPLRLQKILGHSTLKMTQKYINLFSTDLKQGFNTYNPLEKLSPLKKKIK